MLEVLPLSPVREWAISRSFMLTPRRTRRCGLASSRGSSTEATATTSRADLPGAAAAGRAVGVERLDLVADPHGLAQILGAPGDAHAHLVGLVGARGHLRAVQGIDADQVEAQFAGGDAGELQPLAHDVERQPSPRQRAGPGIGDLALADKAVDIADRNFQRVRCAVVPRPPLTRTRSGAISSTVDLREVGNHVGLEILRGVVRPRRATVPCRSAR